MGVDTNTFTGNVEYNGGVFTPSDRNYGYVCLLTSGKDYVRSREDVSISRNENGKFIFKLGGSLSPSPTIANHDLLEGFVFQEGYIPRYVRVFAHSHEEYVNVMFNVHSRFFSPGKDVLKFLIPTVLSCFMSILIEFIFDEHITENTIEFTAVKGHLSSQNVHKLADDIDIDRIYTFNSRTYNFLRGKNSPLYKLIEVFE